VKRRYGLVMGIGLLLVLGWSACGCGVQPTIEPTLQPEIPQITLTNEPELAATRPATPGEPTANLGKIAYVQDGDIWVRALPDGDARPLTTGGQNTAPRWSPSGEWLTFHRGEEVWLMQADGTDAHCIPSASTQDCAWSPADDRLAYIAGQATLCVIEPDELADTGSRGEGHVLLRAAIDDEPLTRIKNLVWSPEGRRLAYVLQSGQPGGLPDRVSLGTIDLESGPRELYTAPSPPQDGLITAGWAPDGQAVLFWRELLFSASGAADGLPLEIAPLDGGQPVVIAEFALLHSDFRRCSPTGQTMALTVGTGRETWTNKRIALANPETASLDYLTDETMSAFSPAFSPDGRQIAYAAAPDIGHVWGGDEAKIGAAQRRIWVMNVDGSNPRPLTGDPAYRDERPQWSADGSHVLFARMSESGHTSLWLIDVTDGTLARVVDRLAPAPEWFGTYGHIDWDPFFDWWNT
jgi:Tol biopolymer transport system component